VTALGSGDFFSVSIAGVYKFTDSISLEATPIYSRANADDPSQTFSQGGFIAGLRVEFAPPFAWMPLRWMVMPYVSLLWDHFDTPNPAVNPFVARRDFESYGGFLVDMPITANLGLSGMVQYARTDSNIANFQFDDFTIMLVPRLDSETGAQCTIGFGRLRRLRRRAGSLGRFPARRLLP